MSSPGSLPGHTRVSRRRRARADRTDSRAASRPRRPALVVGIGDDAAVAAPDRGALQVLTTDALVEGVHFDRRFSSPADIGYKALAVNVSDVAVDGRRAAVRAAVADAPARLTVARRSTACWTDCSQMAAEAGVTLAGGNITRSPGPLVVDVTVDRAA